MKLKTIYDAVKTTSSASFDVLVGDILAEEVEGFDWASGDLILANSACFDADMINLITAKANKMKTGSWFLTLQRQLTADTSQWQLLTKIWLPMSWAPSPVYVHKKVS